LVGFLSSLLKPPAVLLNPQPPQGIFTWFTVPVMSECSHLLSALLEGSRNELPLLSAPIGQYVHNGTVVYT
jgi:hypothetical protein